MRLRSDDKDSKSPGEKEHTPTLTLKSSNGSEVREQLCVYLCIYFIYHPVELNTFLSKYLEFCHSIVLLFSGYAMKRKFPNGSFASPQVLTPNSMLSFYHSNSNAENFPPIKIKRKECRTLSIFYNCPSSLKLERNYI